MDLSKFDGFAKGFDEGVEVEIRHPATGKVIGEWKDASGKIVDEAEAKECAATFHPMSVRIASYQSERVKKVQRKLANTAMREQRRNPKKAATVDEVEEKAHDIMVAAIISWAGFERDGKALDCTPENVRAVLSNPDLWFIAEQIDKAAEDQQVFLTASQTTS